MGKKWIKDNWTTVLSYAGLALGFIGTIVGNEAAKRQLQEEVSEEVTRQLQMIVEYGEED